MRPPLPGPDAIGPLPSGRAPLRRLLVANRGEIAVRIAATARALGIRTVALTTDHDRGALHVAVMDEAVEVAGYLDIPAIIQAASDTGCDAVHPGYGFLSENERFAAAVVGAGLVWVGPPPAAIAAMGSKAVARRLAEEVGVSVVPGYDGDAQDDDTMVREAARIGYPVLVKASAGGGGKGMSVVAAPEGLPAALDAARRLARSAFGDDRLLLERFISPARHVEVQILSDTSGRCIALGERECTIQRRHQKVIEEAPSTAPCDRPHMLADAVKLAGAVGYQGAGTVEFVVDEAGAHWFLEMNTRLQVEHPVTEAVTGLDLVALQLAVAEGRSLLLEPPPPLGWAIEARLYAEDPQRDDLPSTGRLSAWRPPSGVRVDSGVQQGDVVGIHYDPLLAKIVAWGVDREDARRRLVAALGDLVVAGLRTNRRLLAAVLDHPDFVSGRLCTSFLAEHRDTLIPPDDASRLRDAVISAIVPEVRRRRSDLLPGAPLGWRNNRWRDAEIEVAVNGVPRTVAYRVETDHLVVDGAIVRVLADRPLRLMVDGRVRPPPRDVEVELLPDFPVPVVRGEDGGCVAPMPGRVVRVLVGPGDPVAVGEGLVVIEAMKMEQTVRAPVAGSVRVVLVVEGDQVEAGQVLIGLEER